MHELNNIYIANYSMQVFKICLSGGGNWWAEFIWTMCLWINTNQHYYIHSSSWLLTLLTCCHENVMPPIIHLLGTSLLASSLPQWEGVRRKERMEMRKTTVAIRNLCFNMIFFFDVRLKLVSNWVLINSPEGHLQHLQIKHFLLRCPHP